MRSFLVLTSLVFGMQVAQAEDLRRPAVQLHADNGFTQIACMADKCSPAKEKEADETFAGSAPSICQGMGYSGGLYGNRSFKTSPVEKHQYIVLSDVICFDLPPKSAAGKP
jgi:hypothetical protein